MSHSKLNEKLEGLNTKLDEIALQRRLELEAEHLKRITCTKFVRLFCSFSGSSFRINTRVLNDVGIEDKTSFWDLVKRICVCFNTGFTPVEREVEGVEDVADVSGPVEIFEWTKETSTCGFIVPVNESYKTIQILVKLANQRSVYRLSPALAKLLNKLTDTRYNVIKDIYKYVNTHKLNDYATSNIACDEKLEEIFGVKSFNFNGIQAILEPHLQPIFYCTIDINADRIREHGEERKEEDIDMCDNIWDIEIETDDLTQMPVLYPRNVQQLEKKIDDTRVLKRKTRERIEFLTEFSADPAQFINRKIALSSDSIGTKTLFYDDLNVQTALFELVKKKEQ